MLSAIQTIEKALKEIYQIDSSYKVEDFLQSLDTKTQEGLLLIHDESEKRDEISIGVHLGEKTREALATYPNWGDLWAPDQVSAFGVAAEEISHFHYLLFHSTQGRQVSQFELELQGDIDRFLLTYFSLRRDQPEETYRHLYERLFFQFRWVENLSAEQRVRYSDANSFAKKFILKIGKSIHSAETVDATLSYLRKFYRMGQPDRMSVLSR